MEWKRVRLGDYISIKSGLAYKGSKIGKGNSILLGMGCVSFKDKFVESGARSYEEDDRDERFLVKPGDIVLATRQQSNNLPILAMPAIVPNSFEGKRVIFGTNLYKVENHSDISSKFLFWLMKHQHYVNYIASVKSGTAVQMVTKKNVEDYKFMCPPIEVRNRISEILWTYDSLIENNTKRIRLLEKMAENLYKEWFVRFRFPGYEKAEFGDSKYGKLPNTFSIVRMNDVFNYYIGGGWGEEEQSDDFPKKASVIRGADFPNVWHYDVSSCPCRFHKTKNYTARQLKAGDIIMEISGGTSEQPVGRVVLVNRELIDRFEDGRVICASFCKLIRVNKEKVSPYYFYYWMKLLYNTRIIDKFQLQSTGIINFKFESFLRKCDVMLPPKEVMDTFEKQVATLHREMNLLAKQNSLLARRRDLLLPRLMSGKLEVKP